MHPRPPPFAPHRRRRSIGYRLPSDSSLFDSIRLAVASRRGILRWPPARRRSRKDCGAVDPTRRPGAEVPHVTPTCRPRRLRRAVALGRVLLPQALRLASLLALLRAVLPHHLLPPRRPRPPAPRPLIQHGLPFRVSYNEV